MPKPKFKIGDRVRYVGGMLLYNAKAGEITARIQQDGRFYYQTSFTTKNQGSCAECELKITKKTNVK